MSDEIAIKVEHVSKDFVLPHEKVNSIKSLFTSAAKKHQGKSKGVQHALKDISFEIKKGEFFGIVGRNGSGKSTMLKILANIYQPTSGNVYTQGKLVPFIELGVGFNPELTGRENVFLNGAMLGFSEAEVNKMYDDIVDFAELKKFMDQKLKNYSSGMQVRLAFSMAVRAEADILLIDEVLAVGDADFQRKCYDYFRQLKKNNKTVVFVSHDMGAIKEFCDRAALIEKNEIVSIDVPGKIATMYSRLFINGSEIDSKHLASSRWGDGTVQVVKAFAEKQILSDEDKAVQLHVELKAHRTPEELMTGFLVKNSAGQLMNGTNTWKENIKMPKLPKNNTIKVAWEFPNLYSDGQYSVDVYVYGKNNTVYDQFDNALVFQVKRENKTTHLIEPPQNFKVEGTV